MELINPNKYHDEDYDGIVLKIPRGLIDINKLHGEMERLLKVIQKVDKCMYLPDHEKNIYELKQYKVKSEDVRQKQKEEEEQNRKYCEEREKRLQAIRNEDIIESEWQDTTSIGHSVDDVWLSDEENYWELKRCFGTRGKPRAEFKKRLFEIMNDESFNLKKFLQNNGLWLGVNSDKYDIKVEFERLDGRCPIYLDVAYDLSLHYTVFTRRVYVSDTSFRREQLVKVGKGKYKSEYKIDLIKDYEFNGRDFVRKGYKE